MVASTQLRTAAGELRGTASAIEVARTRFDQVLGRLDTVAERTERAWTSAQAHHFVADVLHLRGVIARVPRRLQVAADTTRSLASTADSIAIELAGRERALASASDALANVTRQLSSLDADDSVRSALHESQRMARRAQRSAEDGMELLRSKWGVACSSSASTISMVADVLRNDGAMVLAGPSGGPTMICGGPGGTAAPGGFNWGDALNSAAGVVTSNVVRVPLAVHGAALFGLRFRALGTIVDSYVRREYHRSMRPWRSAATAATRLATLRWRGLSEAMTTSRANTDVRIDAYSARMARAGRVMTAGSGFVKAAGKLFAPLSIYSDGTTLLTGGQYDGVRGGIDVAMAGVGLASSAVFLASAVVVASPVIVGAAVVGATAATLWGIGNLIYDNRVAIGNFGSSTGQSMAAAASRAGSGIANAGSAVASGVGAAGSALVSGASNVGSAVTSGLSRAGYALTSGAGSALSSVGGFLGFGS